MVGTTTIIFMFVAVTVMMVWQYQQARFTCDYCGKYKGHEDNCPKKPLGWGKGHHKGRP